jgi:hypothetical protein
VKHGAKSATSGTRDGASIGSGTATSRQAV